MKNMKQGGKIRLYTAEADCSSSSRFGNGTAILFCSHRDKSLKPYSELIAGYNDLDADARGLYETFIDGCFTEKELEMLERYLRRREVGIDPDVVSSRVKVPVTTCVEAMDFVPWVNLPDSMQENRYDLWNEKGYDLPFRVSALVCASVDEVGDDDIEECTEMFKAFLMNCSIGSKVTDEELKRAVEEFCIFGLFWEAYMFFENFLLTTSIVKTGFGIHEDDSE